MRRMRLLHFNRLDLGEVGRRGGGCKELSKVEGGVDGVDLQMVG